MGRHETGRRTRSCFPADGPLADEAKLRAPLDESATAAALQPGAEVGDDVQELIRRDVWTAVTCVDNAADGKVPTMSVVVDIDALESRYSEAIRTLPFKRDNLRDYLVRRTLESRKRRVARIRDLLAIEKFELVFIGKVGTGKTTAICNLFNLTSEVERGHRKKTEPLLATGTGRSTICEVQILRSDKTAIEIDPLSPGEMRDLLTDFSDSIFARVHPERHERPTDGLSTELDRAIRNIVDLNKVEHDGKEIDPAMELARQEGSGDAFVGALLKAAELDSRKESRAVFPGGNEFEWLQDLFKKLNVGRCNGFTIPKCIRVFLGSSLVSDGYLDSVSCIRDTKGLDEILVRADINRYVEDEHALCLFSSSFAGAPDSEVLNYVERHLQDPTSGFERRCILLVLPRNGEAANLLGADGNPVDEEEVGEAIKASQARLAFQNRGLNFLAENIVFCDAMRGYEKGRLDRPDQAAEGRRAFFGQLEKIINNRRTWLQDAAGRLGNELSSLLGGSSVLQPEDRRVVAEVRTLLGQSAVDIHAEDFVYTLMQFLRQQRRAIQFHALNRRFGVHGDASIFEFAKVHTYDLVRHATRQEFNRVANFAAGLRERASPDLALFLTELEQQLRIRYETYLKTVSSRARDLVEELLLPRDLSNEFWQAAIAEWGKGPGYWDRESNDYEQGLEGAGERLMKIADDAWKTEIMDPLVAFLAEDG